MLFKLFAIAALAVAVSSLPATPEPPKAFKVCDTQECKRAAEIITSHIDESKDPCEDWYLYSCGKFAEVNPLPEGASSVDALTLVNEGNEARADATLDNPSLKTHGSKIVRKIKQLYDECLKESGETFLGTLRRKNRDYLLRLREKMIEEVAQKGKVETFVPHKIPTVEEIMKMKMSDKGECRTAVASKYEFAFVRAWLDKFMNKSATAEARKVINNVHSAILNRMNISWATPDDKQTYRDQLSKLERNLVYPDWVVDDGELDAEYANDSISSIHHLIDDFAKHPNWPMPILMVNAHFSTANEITIPAGILQDLIFNYKSVPSLNYGAAGFIAGHEMSHAMNYYLNNAAGKSAPLDCISNQLTSVREPQTGGRYWFGRFLLSEALADVGGINASLIAFKDAVKEDLRLPGPASKFTPEQLFFLGAANSWCHHSTDSSIRFRLFIPLGHPFNYHRVVIPAMNSPDFAKAFNCKAGTPMNPVDKCRLW